MGEHGGLPHADHFDSWERQEHAGFFGMWLFLASEVLLFAAMFGLYGAYRLHFEAGFVEGIGHNLRWAGTLNTFILLVSSYCIARSVPAVRARHRRAALGLIATTLVLGVAFLVVKSVEYADHIHEGIVPGGATRFFADHPTPGLATFFNLYYLMTIAHAVHVTIGLGVIVWLALRIRSAKVLEVEAHPLELGAMYWHLVDIVWIFLWPLFYLAGGHG
jgi:cytochrome c oxidase subunit 3